MDTAVAALHRVAPTVGAEFSARHFQSLLDGCNKYTLGKTLDFLRDAGHIQFTGKVLTWRRIK